jgi:Cu(I)/Ag(I) efflux system membrane protein CusA/SilA
VIRGAIEFCVRQPLLTLLATAIVVAIGVYCAMVVPIDAIPNIGENQVIVFTEWPGRSPKDVENQVTYPLSVALLTVPHAESVRGKSMFGYSFVQVTFADGTDFYWARSRVLERLGTAIASLPSGVTPTLGPDATALGQIFYYVLQGPPEMNLAELRSIQDYVLRYELQSVQGVSEVASVGGYVRQYQIEVDPDALRFQDIPLDRLIAAVKDSNIDVGAKTVESGGMEFVIRGRGFIGQD